MNRSKIALGVRALQLAAALALAAVVAACTSGGAPTTQLQQTTAGPTTSSYTGPAAANADVQSFKINLWENIRVSNRCGGCHHEGGQAPMFARSDDVNLAYQAANPLVNFAQPDQSELVLKVSGGHNCWVADPKSCGDTMLTWIKAWIGAGSASATSITLQVPPSHTVGAGLQFPAGDPSGFQQFVYPLLAGTPAQPGFCVGCHRPDAATPQQPYFASSDVNEAYAAAQPKIDLNNPSNSRFVVRLRDEFHNCWATASSNGAADCPGSSAAMLKAIQDYAGSLGAPAPVDASLLLSKALALKEGTIASGGNRYEANLVAKYEFKTGSGTTAYDTSGVDPEADLQFTGPVDWVGGWGINITTGGKAQASTASSAKLASMITSTGEYSIEAWAAPADVAQTDANIVSYSGSDTTRNASLIQHAMQYEARTRSDQTDPNGKPPLQTAVANANAQAALQHVVLTYDPVNGQKLYVNGKFTGDVDTAKGGSLASWDNTFALVMGAETTGKRQWQGVIKFAAIHSRALTADQVQQNFAAGVGERYFLLFDVTDLTGVPQSYIMVTASQYDSYSYLFTNPTFISLNPNATPANVPIKGIRIGINGAEASAGQSFATVNTTLGGTAYTAAAGQLLSGVGAVIGPAVDVNTDQFYLLFDQLGSKTHVHTEPPSAIPVDNSNTPFADVGVKTFAQLNATMSAITGVSVNNSAVLTTYNSLQQSLPPAPQINAFLSANQTAISQLAVQYCTTLMSTPASIQAVFGSTVAGALTTSGASFFGTSTANIPNRHLVVDQLIARAVGSNVNAATAGSILQEIGGIDPTTGAQISNSTTYNNTLITKLANTTDNVSAIVKASCSAVVGSAAVSLQ